MTSEIKEIFKKWKQHHLQFGISISSVEELESSILQKEHEDNLKDLTDISGKEIIRLKQQLKEQPKQIFVDIDNSIYDVDGKLIELKSIIDTLEILKKKWLAACETIEGLK